MRAGTASLTAQIVSFSRGLATLAPRTRPPLHDHVAGDLLPAPFAQALRACAASPAFARVAASVASVASLGLVDHLTLRTLAIDDAVRGAVRDGATQLVILGAGLDARAWRMPELAGVTVLEVDHPDTQREKRRHLGALVPTARAVRFVPVDFARDALGERLEAGGHVTAARTAWVWEGVTMYLPIEATRATLDVVAARSAPGSVLAATYSRPEMITGWLGPASRLIFGVLGEPIVGAVASDALARELDGRGFTTLSDEDDDAFRPRYGARVPRFSPFSPERLVVARKR